MSFTREELLRRWLVEKMRREGNLRSPEVEQAFLTVSRYHFVEEFVADVTEAYADEVIRLRAGVSTASQPSIMALMLEELAVCPGNRVLEVGTASGYGAALLAELVGPEGRVVTVELEEDLARRAAEKLAVAGYHQVEVHVGDGSKFLAPPASFDRIIVTAAVDELPAAWLWELSPAGWLLTPFQLPAATLLLKLQRGVEPHTRWKGGFVGVPVAFVPLRRGPAGGWWEYGTLGASDGGEGAREEKVLLPSWNSKLVHDVLEMGWECCWRGEDFIGLLLWSLLAEGEKNPAKVLQEWLEAGRPGPSFFEVVIRISETGLVWTLRKRNFSEDTEEVNHDAT